MPAGTEAQYLVDGRLRGFLLFMCSTEVDSTQFGAIRIGFCCLQIAALLHVGAVITTILSVHHTVHDGSTTKS